MRDGPVSVPFERLIETAGAALLLGILAVIYWKLNQNGQLGELGRIFANCDRLWMPLSLAMVRMTGSPGWSTPRGA